MVSTETSLSRLPGIISDYFVLETKFAATRTADAYKALDRFKRQSIGVWVTRGPIRPEQVHHFGARIQSLAAVGATTDVLSYGVDASGLGFVVFPVFDGQRLNGSESSLEMIELERRYLAAIRIVERLHHVNLSCGDLCLDSFMVDRGGNVQLIGVLGSFENLIDKTADLPPVDSLSYVAPEQRGDGGASQTIDVYALGVLGYLLFVGKLPSEGALVPVSTVNPKAPAWLDDVLVHALSTNPSARPQNATALLQAIAGAKERDFLRQTAPAVVEDINSRAPTGPYVTSAVQIPVSRPLGSEAPRVPEPNQPNPNRPFKLGVLGQVSIAGLCFVTGWIVYLIVTKPGPHPAPTSVLPGDVRLHAKDNEANPLEYIQGLAASDDPIAHDSLIRAYKDAPNAQVREAVWKAALDRSRRLGLLRSSDQLRSFMKLQPDALEPPEVEALLRVLDPGMPINLRLDLLNREYSKRPPLMLKLTAALALDLSEPEDFREILASMATDLAQVSGAREHSALSLMLLLPELSSSFLDEVLSVASKIPDSDITWLLDELSRRNAGHLQAVADLALSRKLVVGPQQTFLEVVRKKNNLPSAVAVALVQAAIRGISKNEISVFGTWYDQDSEKVLLTCLALAKEPDISLGALDALGAKAINDPFLSNLLEFIRLTYRENRGALVNLIGVIALEGQLPEAQFKAGFDDLEKIPKTSELVSMLLKSNSPNVIREVTDRYAGILDVTTLLDLLEHKDKNVRIAAIKHLKNANDIAALKLLLDGYDKEKDPDVKTAYEENITVVKERRGASRGGG